MRILGVGVATVDIINSVDQYPLENQELRANSNRIQRGGNAANTLCVLSQLGHQCTFAGTLTNSPQGKIIRDDFTRHDIDISACSTSNSNAPPTSYITLNETNGSRTIVHYRDQSEFTYTDFLNIDLDGFDWIHFEGRAIKETYKMLARCRKTCPSIPVSLEVEKPRKHIESLFAFANTLFFSQYYATQLGFYDSESFILLAHKNGIPQERVCTWGHKDGVAIDKNGKLFKSHTHPPEKIVDTLAAGDTFNAGFIDAKLRKFTLRDTLESANKLAGKKCGQHGLDNLAKCQH